jgi:hypothetical protein
MPVRTATAANSAATFITALAAALVSALPASGAPFDVKHGHWSVMSASPVACMALNRPAEEWNFAPYNALALRQRRGSPLSLQVYAWPGVFKQGQKVTIAITIDGTRTELPAQAADSYYAETSFLPPELLAQLRAARTAEFSLSGVESKLLFDVSAFDTLMTSLEECVRQLPG